MKHLVKGLLLAASLALAGPAFAAGGHHAVDDAAILEPGQCELESWFSRGRGERGLHAGANCRVGPVEVGLAAEHARFTGAGSQTGWGAQVKWAGEVADRFSVGVSLSPGWAAHNRPRYQGFTLAGLATWTPVEPLALHLNIGRDFAHRGSDEDRYGVAAEWFPIKPLSLLLERYREEGSHFARAGVRWASERGWSVDLSRAQRLQGPGVSNWTIGVGYIFDRK